MNNIKPQSFKDLLVWQKSAELGVEIYRLTAEFPRTEAYGLSDQMRRAVISISSNLAEGFERNHSREKVQFYNVAHASSAELESQVEMAYRLGFIDRQKCEELTRNIVEVSKMTYGLCRPFRSALHPPSSILHPRAGFTMIELLVAVGLFGILITIAVGGFVQALKTQRQTAALLAANSSLSLTMEQMSREIRVASGFVIKSDPHNGSQVILELVNGYGQPVIYCRDSSDPKIGYISRVVNWVSESDCATSPAQRITTNLVNVRRISFIQAVPDTSYPPRITLAFDVSPGLQYGSNPSILHIQTTVSARNL